MDNAQNDYNRINHTYEITSKKTVNFITYVVEKASLRKVNKTGKRERERWNGLRAFCMAELLL
jgi:hypothetical protein